MGFIKFVFSGGWIFLGFSVTLYSILFFIFAIYNRSLRHINIFKHGYPPEHCNADGEFKTDKRK